MIRKARVQRYMLEEFQTCRDYGDEGEQPKQSKKEDPVKYKENLEYDIQRVKIGTYSRKDR